MSSEVSFCPGCNIPRESLHSTAQHAWKSQDEDHEEMADLDTAIVAVVEHNVGGGETAPDGNEPTTPNPPEPSTEDGPEPSEDTEGGGGLGLEPVEAETSTAPEDAVEEEEEEEDDELTCPYCSDELGAAPEDIDPSTRYECTACGERFDGAEVSA